MTENFSTPNQDEIEYDEPIYFERAGNSDEKVTDDYDLEHNSDDPLAADFADEFVDVPSDASHDEFVNKEHSAVTDGKDLLEMDDGNEEEKKLRDELSLMEQRVENLTNEQR